MNRDHDWIGEKILATEDQQLMDILRGEKSEPETHAPSFDVAAFPVATPVDPAAEHDAFAELLEFFASNPEADCDVTALSLDEFNAPSVPETIEPQE